MCVFIQKENLKYFLPIYDLLFCFSNGTFWRVLPETLPLYPTISAHFSYVTQEISLYVQPG